MGISERQKEIKRRRHRRQKLSKLKKRIENASASEKSVIADKLRAMTPGGEQLVGELGLK